MLKMHECGQSLKGNVWENESDFTQNVDIWNYFS